MEDNSDTRIKKIDFDTIAKVYAKKGGNMSATAMALNISRIALWKWRNEFPELKAKMDEVEESLIDLSESKLIESIQSGNLTAIIFHLKTKGKSRGYIEGQDIRARISSDKNLSIEEASEFIKKLENEH